MIDRLADWARGRPTRPALLIRAMLGRPERGDEALRGTLAQQLDALPVEPHLAALAWRAIELMDLVPPDPARLDRLQGALSAPPSTPVPLEHPSGTRLTDAATAALAGEALALRALVKGGRGATAEVRKALDDLARRGPALPGVAARALALHGVAADAVHHPGAVDRLVDALARAQHPDGSWGADELFLVGQALLAVERPAAEAALRAALPALGREQREDGGFGSEERGWIACRWSRRIGG